MHTRETVEALTASPNNPFTHAPTRRVDTPRLAAISRFCITLRILRPSLERYM